VKHTEIAKLKTHKARKNLSTKTDFSKMKLNNLHTNTHTHTHTHTHNVSNKLQVIPEELQHKDLCYIMLKAKYPNTDICNVREGFANVHAITCFSY
jgi:hypothetical protein